MSRKTEERLRHEIMTNVKANGIEVTGDFWLMLVFRTEAQLREICREMKIRI
jgi:hypothetical protein